MATVQQMVRQLADGRLDLDQVERDFASRPWPSPRRATPQQLAGVHDFDPPTPNSPDWIELEPRLTEEQRMVLRHAYDQAQQ